MAFDATTAGQGGSGTVTIHRRGGFRSLVFISLGLLFGLIGQLYLMRQRYPLDGAVFYVIAVLLFYRGVREVADPAAPALAAYAYHFKRLLPSLLVGSLALVLFEREHIAGSGAFDGGQGNGYLSLVAWLAAMLLLVIAYWRQGLTEAGKIRLGRWELLALAAILLLALFMRVYNIGSQPGNLYLDEGDHGLLALRLLRFPGYVNYVPDLTGHATLWFYGLGIWIKLVGLTIVKMRLYSVMIGMLAVVATYFLGRELLGPRGALIVAFVIAISRWHINFSRYIFTAGMVTLAMALVMFLLLRALRTRQPLDFIWAGLAFALGLSAYLPVRFVLPGVVGLYLVFKVLGNRAFLRMHAHGLVLFVFAFLIGVMPMAVYFQKYPDLLLARAEQASVSQDIQRAQSLAPLKANITKAFEMFNFLGDPRPRHNLPNAPMLDPITGILFVLGAGYCLFRVRKAEYAILLVWLVLGVIPGVLSLADSNPHSMRTIANLPAVCMLAAIALDRSWQFARDRYGARGEQRFLSFALVVGIVALGLNGYTYFVRQAGDKSVYYDYDPVQTQVAREVMRLGKTQQVYVAGAYTNHSAVKLLGTGMSYATFNQAQHLPIRDVGTKDVTFILEPVHRVFLSLFQKYYPNARVTSWADKYGNPGFIEVTVTHDEAQAAQGIQESFYPGLSTGAPAQMTRKQDTIAADWAADAPLAPPFTAVWHGALYVSRYGPHTLTLDASESATVTLDSEVVLTTTGGSKNVNLTLFGGFHEIEVTSAVTQNAGALSLRWRTPDGSEQSIPRSSLYAADVAINGLLGKYYRGNSWSGTPAVQQKDLFISPNDLLPAPFSIEWEGKIYAPQDGQFVFGALSDDGSQLYIDNKMVVDNGGHHSDRYVEGRVQLTQGLHDLRLRYFQDDGGRAMELYWIPPGGQKQLVPTGALFPPGTVLSGPITITSPIVLPSPVAPVTTPQPVAPSLPGVKPPVPIPGTGARVGEIGPLRSIGEGGGPGQLRGPRGVAVDSAGNIYVADTGNKRVVKFDSQGKFLAEWKGGAEPFVEPVAVAIAPNGDIYVLEPEKDGAQHFSASGQYLGKVGDGLGLYRPRGLNIDAAGILYFANTGGNNVVRTSSGGQPGGNVGVAGKQNGQFEQPTDVNVDTAGNIYVADTYNQRIQLFTADGRYITQWAIPVAGTALGPHLALGAEGAVYITDPDNHQFSAYSPDGSILATWGGQGAGDGLFVQPVGIAVAADGLVYIADSGNNRIQVWGKR